MKRILFLCLALLAIPVGAHAQSTSAVVVATCGTPPTTYSAGQNRQVTQDTGGKLCSSDGIVLVPSSASTAGVAPVQSSAVETGHVIKAAPGNLYNFNVSADGTLSAAVWEILIFNSTTVPAAGAVTPVKCYIVPAGTTSVSGAFPMPMYLSTGISIAVSTATTCFTKTDSAHAFISANAQ